MNPTITTARLRDIPVSVEACAAEIRQITTWTSVWDLTAPSSLRWKTTYEVFTLVGYSTDPLSVQDVRTEALRCFLAGGKLAPRTPDLVRDTTAAKDFPACLKVAASLPGITERVQLRVLGPRGILPRHIDPIESVPTVRFHIPITLPDGCSFFAWDAPDWAVDHCYEVCRAPGEVWFVHIFAEPHMIVNRSTTQRRDHLVVDKFLDDPLRQYLAQPPRTTASTASRRRTLRRACAPRSSTRRDRTRSPAWTRLYRGTAGRGRSRISMSADGCQAPPCWTSWKGL
jgi:hypothetical protein